VADRQTYIDLAKKYSKVYGVPADLFLAQLNQESRFDPNARSYADARGIAQIVPKWHPDVNPNIKGNQLPGVNPEWDIAYGARLMSNHYKKYGSWERALSAYNSGQPDKYLDPNFSKGQTYNYVKAILAGRKAFAGAVGAGKNETFGKSDTHLPEVSTTQQDSQKHNMAQWIMANNQLISQGQLPNANPMLFQQMIQQSATGGPPAPASPRGDIPAAPKGNSGKNWERVVQAIKYAQSLGLSVRENPYVDKVDPVHTKGSHHYQTYPGTNVGRAVDVSGDPTKLKAYFKWLEKNYSGLLNDMFYGPMGYSYDAGKYWGKTIGGHDKHVHASFY